MDINLEIKLAENLQKVLQDRKISVTALAKQIGMNKSTLHGYCNGVVPRNLLKLHQLAAALDVPFIELVFGHRRERISSESLKGRYELIVQGQIQIKKLEEK